MATTRGSALRLGYYRASGLPWRVGKCVSHVPGPGLRPNLAWRARSRASSCAARWEGDEPCWDIETGIGNDFQPAVQALPGEQAFVSGPPLCLARPPPPHQTFESSRACGESRPPSFSTHTHTAMSGRGKGGKGLGKGGAKRHRKVLRDNIQGITKPAIRRLARRGGVKRIPLGRTLSCFSRSSTMTVVSATSHTVVLPKCRVEWSAALPSVTLDGAELHCTHSSTCSLICTGVADSTSIQ